MTRAKQAVLSLHEQIRTVQLKARQSEMTVQEITKEMKRLDCAKKHLSRTITALKRLHMLLYAVGQLRRSVRVCEPPDYKSAANLVGAVQLLLGHFRGYMESVEEMRLLKEDVEEMRVDLYDGIVWAFRVVVFGSEKAEVMMSNSSSDDNSGSDSRVVRRDRIPLSPSSLRDACHVLDALGVKKKREFMDLFCRDHLERYVQLFHPKNNTSAGGAQVVSSPVKPSFKMILATTSAADHHGNPNSHSGSSGSGNTSGSGMEEDASFLGMGEGANGVMSAASSNPNPASLDQIERRYAWYRRMLKELDEAFPNVFPSHWNMEYHMTFEFLMESRQHLLLLFSGNYGSSGSGSGGGNSGEGGAEPNKALRDRDCENVTVLLKALQKTILFEKEMTAWLQRECGTRFDEEDGKKGKQMVAKKMQGEQQDLNQDGRKSMAVANSAEGYRMEREREWNKNQKIWNDSQRDMDDEDVDDATTSMNRSGEGGEGARVSVSPLIGVASSAFENYMGPYIALEEQNMEEQLKEAASDSTVDTRGELPVFVSSTNLFLYIKNSITRCTTLTKGKTLFLLYRAFQRILKKYAKVLSSKYPSALSGAAAAIGGLGITGLTAGSSSGIKEIYRIPNGEETVICHVIGTCEYCSETVEALQDLIIDKIDDKFKSKIDMSAEEEVFHDVTAKGIKVLVSGLVHRTDQAFKGMYNINWSALDAVGEESPYVRAMHNEVQPFVLEVKSILPNSYFRNFCDQFAMFFTNAFYNTITRQKRISETGTQQLLLDVYNLKTLMLKLPVLDKTDPSSSPNRSPPKNQVASSIAPAVYTKMVTKQFQRIETLLKLVGTPSNLLIDVFKVQWHDGTPTDLQTVMTLKGMKRNDQTAMLEKFGVDPIVAMKSTAIINDNLLSLQDKSSDVAAKVNNDLIQMREKVERFRGAFR